MKQINKRMETAFASEKVLAKEWNSKESNEAWKDINENRCRKMSKKDFLKELKTW
jgi:hypothetical protein